MSASLLLMACALSACGQRASRAYVQEIEAWRADRLERLRADDGWLTLVGLFWLEPGVNRIGSGAECVVRLDGLPERDGSLILTDDGTVWALGGTMTVGGSTIADARALTTDAAGSPDVVTVGPYRLHIIDRSGRLGVRVGNPDNPARTGFSGIEHFPIDATYRVEARLEPYDEPREISVATVIGTASRMLAPGQLHFQLDGRELTLLPLVSEPAETDLFIVFRDATSGNETYGAGRFLSAELEADGHVVLDFNRAVNPPCAFTPYATCPLPPPENMLEVQIRAGERYSGPVH